MITRKNFLSVYCQVFTLISLTGAILDIIGRRSMNYSQFNLFNIAVFSLIGLAIVSQAFRLSNLSPLKMLIVLYLTGLACIYLIVWIGTLFGMQVAEGGGWDIFRSFSVPYLIILAVYLYRIRKETKKQNSDLHKLRESRARQEAKMAVRTDSIE